MARKYSKKASAKVGRAMKKRKAGTLKSGRSGRKVKSRKQAIAIGLSEARAEGRKSRRSVRRKGRAPRSANQKGSALYPVIARSNATKQPTLLFCGQRWIASRSLSSGAHFARPVGSR
jgi:hypothetical protein